MSFLVGCARIGYACTCKQVLAIVQAVVAKKQGLEPEDVKITYGWWASFRKHSKLTPCSASRLAYARAVAQDSEVISAYCELLEETLIKNNLMDKPGQILNYDELGFPLRGGGTGGGRGVTVSPMFLLRGRHRPNAAS